MHGWEHDRTKHMVVTTNPWRTDTARTPTQWKHPIRNEHAYRRFTAVCYTQPISERVSSRQPTEEQRAADGARSLVIAPKTPGDRDGIRPDAHETARDRQDG
jgi:hypothetical protein